MPMNKAIGSIKGAMGLDFHVLSTIVLRGWGIGAGFLTTLLLPFVLSPVELGYYFSFASILALQIFFELGFNQVITQVAAHEAAELVVDDDGSMNGASIHLARLGALSDLTRRWYLFAGVAFVLSVGAAGLWFFGRDEGIPLQNWAMPWLALVLATGFNLYLSPRLALFEGCGRVGNVARLRLNQSVIGYGCAWVTLIAGGGLWAAVCIPLTSCIATTIWLNRHRRFGSRFLMATEGEPAISWRRDILPLQWRISLSWVSGYFIYSLFTPLIFSTAGAVAAGRFGLTMAIFTGLSTVAMSWLYAKVPEFSRYASRRDFDMLGRLFRGAAMRAVGMTLVLCVSFVGAVQAISYVYPSITGSLLGLTDLSLLAVAVIANAAISAAAIYMRSFKEEPMLPVSIGTAILASCAVYFGSRIGVTEMLGLYATTIVVVMLPWTILVFRQYSSRLRQSANEIDGAAM